MPELPEVETITQQLNSILPGKTIVGLEVLHPKSFRSDPTLLAGKTIKAVSRKAKMFYISFQHIDDILAGHLKMTGQLIYIPGKDEDVTQRVVGGHPTADWVASLPGKHTRIITTFTDSSTLYFNDMRIFGWLALYDPAAFQLLIDSKPPDVTDPTFNLDYLARALARTSQPVKVAILDQAKMGGIGNIYANDALWIAKVHPEKPAKELTKPEIARLHKAIVQVINRGIELGGATESDYVDSHGMGGQYQHEFKTYKQEGQACQTPGCTGTILKAKVGGRGTYWCPVCQRLA